MSQKKKRKPGVSRHNTPRSKAPLLIIAGGVALVAIAGLLIFGGGTPASPPAAVEVSGAPALKVDKEKVDVGDVRLGESVTVNFELANAGDQPLRFTEQPYVTVVEGC
jgi:hypothetical protein